MKFSILLRIVGSGGGAGATDGTDGLIAAVLDPADDGTEARAFEAVDAAPATDPVVSGALAVVSPLEPQPAASIPVPNSIATVAAR